MSYKTDLSVNLCGVTLKNPIITVSGTCGYGDDYIDYYSPAELGGDMVANAAAVVSKMKREI